MVQQIFNLKSQQQWGYKLKYDLLVLSLRHPPLQPLAGIKSSLIQDMVALNSVLGTDWVS